MKTYEVEFIEAALKEWHKLDGSIRALFRKQLAKRMRAPHVPSARLHGDLQNTYKIKLRDAGYRLVYEVIDRQLVILVIAVGRRDHDEAYLLASKRLNS
ncbi:MAG: type II toxin-antitoxin system RelE/ParE family toxin [Curvibacter sp.]